jgi:gas vesicle protein
LLDVAADLIKEKNAEIERLEDLEKNVYETVDELTSKIKADAIKEFAEKVKEETYHYYDSDIDKLAKEMRVQKDDK